MKPLVAFGATINPISIRNKILLITPLFHILSHRMRPFAVFLAQIEEVKGIFISNRQYSIFLKGLSRVFSKLV